MHFKGRVNAGSASQWIIDNIPSPDRVVAVGSSAGGVGVTTWSYTIAEYYSQLSNPPPVAFAMTAAIPRYAEGNTAVLRDVFNLCDKDTFLWTDEMYNDCLAGNLDLPDIQIAAMKKHPRTPFAIVMYKYDNNSVGRNGVTPREDYGHVKEMARIYTNVADNPLENNQITYFLNDVGHVVITGNTVFQHSNSRSVDDRMITLFEKLATYDGDTVIKSSCRPQWTFNQRVDYSCDNDLLAATYGGESETCRSQWSFCREDSDCCSRQCGFFGLCCGVEFGWR